MIEFLTKSVFMPVWLVILILIGMTYFLAKYSSQESKQKPKVKKVLTKEEHEFAKILWIGFLVFATIVTSIILITDSIPYEHDIQINCNSGFIGIEMFENKSFMENSSNADFFSLKNIDGANCDIRIKGTMSNKILKELMEQ